MLSPTQIALRRSGVGASELFDVLNNPYALWHRKVTGHSTLTGNEDFIRIGNLFERPTAQDYAYRRAQAGTRIRLVVTETPTGDAVTLQDPKRPWLLGTPDFLPVLDKVGAPTSIADLKTLWHLRDVGLLDRGLEIKTGSAVAEQHLEDDDRWGHGYRAQVEEVQALLDGRCDDPVSLARDLMARFSLQHHIGAEAAQADGDEWGDSGTAQMPRRYLAQCAGYMALTGLEQWDLHRLRFGYGRLETVTYTVMRDVELEGLLLEAAERFVRDHLATKKPPTRVTVDDRLLELARVFPKDSGIILKASADEDMLLERYRAAVIDAKRANVRKDLLETTVKETIGDAKGITGGSGKVTFGYRAGRATIDAKAAIAALVDKVKQVLPASDVDLWAQEALAIATREGEGYRSISRPAAWTKGIEAQTKGECDGE